MAETSIAVNRTILALVVPKRQTRVTTADGLAIEIAVQQENRVTIMSVHDAVPPIGTANVPMKTGKNHQHTTRENQVVTDRALPIQASMPCRAIEIVAVHREAERQVANDTIRMTVA